jgi:hypothetical protein
MSKIKTFSGNDGALSKTHRNQLTGDPTNQSWPN